MSHETLKVHLQQLLTALLALSLAGSAAGQAPEPLYPKLTPRLQNLLREEMLSVNAATQQILTALVSGNHAEVGSLARQIHDSFIMKRAMSPSDKEHLMAVAPPEFLQMDHAFHEISAGLAQAADSQDAVLQRERFDQMIDACHACHRQFATDRFPGLLDP